MIDAKMQERFKKVYSKRISVNTMLDGRTLQWYANAFGPAVYHGEKYVMIDMTESISTTDGEIIYFAGHGVKIGDNIREVPIPCGFMPITKLYRLEYDEKHGDDPRAVHDCGLINLVNGKRF